MTTKFEMLRRIRRQYREETGRQELDHHEVARYAVKRFGWRLPQPKDPIDLLVRDISEAARLEERTDKKTGESYRANLAYSVKQGKQQLTFWVDTDEATRSQVVRASQKGRDQLVGEAYRWALTLDHWNRINPDEESVQMELDLGPDVQWLRNAPKDSDKKAG
jgi:hypothetical protein